MDKKSIFKLIGSILICMSAGIIGSLFVGKEALIWYKYLLKSELTPPNWLFAPVWAILYLLMGISLYIVLNKKNSIEKKHALLIFGVQLFLNALWTPVFFGLRSFTGGFFVIILLWISIFLTFYKFFKLSKTAAYLLIPYLFWVSYATGLNLTIWILNS